MPKITSLPQNFLGGMRPTNKKIKIKQPCNSRTGNFIYILAIVYLVPVNEKGYLKCIVDKNGYSN
jgi:hypothetical protein